MKEWIRLLPKKLTGLIVLLLPLASFGYVKRDLLQKQGSVQQLKSLLLPREQWIPYPAYKDRTGWDRLMGHYKNAFIERGNTALSYQWKVIKATDYLEYARSGSRVVMETPFNDNLTAIVNLFVAELAEGKGRYMDQLANGVFATCEMTSWSLSAHLSLQSSKILFPDHREQIIDLVAGDTGSLFAWIYYYFHDGFKKINPLLELRLKKELESRIIEPYMKRDDFWWMALRYKSGDLVNNWNPWCNSNVLQTYALIEDDPEKLASAVYRTMTSVDQFINYTNEDGACEEGPSYWGHAAGKLYDYLQLLYDMTGGKISLFGEPIIKNMGTYISRAYVGNGWVVNFADASAKLSPDAPLIYRYGRAVNSTEMMQLAALLQSSSKERNAPSEGRDLYRLLQSLRFDAAIARSEPAHNVPAYTWYPQTEVCYMREGGMFFAAKGGHNNESHNHNDVGSFNLYIDNTPVLIDAGVGTYTRQTFGPERYSIWTMQSTYHNVPESNGYAQKNGAAYKARGARFDPAAKTFSLDLAGAYPEAAGIKTWKRSYRLKAGGLEIRDQFVMTRAAEKNRLHFLCQGTVTTPAPGKIVISQGNLRSQLQYEEQLFDRTVDTVNLDDRRLSNVWGNRIYRITLTAKKAAVSGRYMYTIKRL
ncbi:heparinase II/III domain-containing protein [Niabella drilacis]|uniref:Heparinase II/III-like protein n=1 Tax=Niabella drilacis (strain DSM 25811 / CCM 8410 / CCUG 62505 / LMG 26954 / E90) TaxID=1285928 RepID=A0A1G7AQ30_NIADE|nr:heparinase II/III family protein [Niabella drilacis]SDE16790.1 Heparinase II/III-like protein [Niabella drilacis]